MSEQVSYLIGAYAGMLSLMHIGNKHVHSPLFVDYLAVGAISGLGLAHVICKLCPEDCLTITLTCVGVQSLYRIVTNNQ